MHFAELHLQLDRMQRAGGKCNYARILACGKCNTLKYTVYITMRSASRGRSLWLGTSGVRSAGIFNSQFGVGYRNAAGSFSSKFLHSKWNTDESSYCTATAVKSFEQMPSVSIEEIMQLGTFLSFLKSICAHQTSSGGFTKICESNVAVRKRYGDLVRLEFGGKNNS